jgi:hypothetical protein
MPATFYQFRNFLNEHYLDYLFDDYRDRYDILYRGSVVRSVESRIVWNSWDRQIEDETLVIVKIFKCFT